jgi:nanoRNase/pAp phosphatase (c-di-AMP/oligoRNAs hydrolase)
MSLLPSQQFQDLLKKTVSPLIILPSYPSRDTVASAYALALFLKNTGKVVTLASEHIDADKDALSFLTQPDNTLTSIAGARDFVLAFNTSRNKILSVRTENTDDEVRVYLTPENGSIDPRDFSFIPAKFKYDLAVVIGAPDKEHLGKIYEDNPDIFYEIPIVNIDNHPENEQFGQINLVDITASSNAEILAEALESADPKFFTEMVSECLLAGIISATDSFQKRNTTPKALKLASRLMDKGADQQKIVRSLYKTQPLHLLKLWGRVMAQVKWDEDLKLIWAFVTIEDLVQARARVEDLPHVLEKIKSNYSSARLYMILHMETNALVRGVVKAHSSDALTFFTERFKEGMLHGDTVSFVIPANSQEEAEHVVMSRLQNTPASTETL